MVQSNGWTIPRIYYKYRGESLRLVGIDTDDGRGERVIIGQASGYAKPLITPKGDRIVFTNRRTHGVFVVNWDGTNLRQVDNGWAADVWAEPDTGAEWVYVRRGPDKNSPMYYDVDGSPNGAR
ncbi:MAG TPA: hypothetical protein VM186_08575 [Planctomycetota bacterium]|nr:hypothetical protein [Planctomycetota bacterium]